jgi:hypothetical protein
LKKPRQTRDPPDKPDTPFGCERIHEPPDKSPPSLEDADRSHCHSPVDTQGHSHLHGKHGEKPPDRSPNRPRGLAPCRSASSEESVDVRAGHPDPQGKRRGVTPDRPPGKGRSAGNPTRGTADSPNNRCESSHAHTGDALRGYTALVCTNHITGQQPSDSQVPNLAPPTRVTTRPRRALN